MLKKNAGELKLKFSEKTDAKSLVNKILKLKTNTGFKNLFHPPKLLNSLSNFHPVKEHRESILGREG